LWADRPDGVDARKRPAIRFLFSNTPASCTWSGTFFIPEITRGFAKLLHRDGREIERGPGWINYACLDHVAVFTVLCVESEALFLRISHAIDDDRPFMSRVLSNLASRLVQLSANVRRKLSEARWTSAGQAFDTFNQRTCPNQLERTSDLWIRDGI
jgi:hypothetical protein